MGPVQKNQSTSETCPTTPVFSELSGAKGIAVEASARVAVAVVLSMGDVTGERWKNGESWKAGENWKTGMESSWKQKG